MRHDVMGIVRRSSGARAGLDARRQLEDHYGNAELMMSWQNDKISALERNIKRLEKQVKDLSSAIKVTSEDRGSARHLSGEPVKTIAVKVSEMTGISVDDILSTNRLKEVAKARQLVMFMAREAGYSLSFIGRVLKRDHTSVMHGIRKEAERRAARAAKEAAAS